MQWKANIEFPPERETAQQYAMLEVLNLVYWKISGFYFEVRSPTSLQTKTRK